MTINKKNVTMIGSVPMSLGELPMAPAVLAARVKSLGHDFRFLDINLLLYNLYDRDKNRYEAMVEKLQSASPLDSNEFQIWISKILDNLENSHLILLNVFSVFSQMVVWRLCHQIKSRYPNIPILLGGIGSHKTIFGGINKFNQSWINDHFNKTTSDIFGQMLLDQDLVDDWQKNVDTNILDRWLPKLPSKFLGNLDFSVYDIEDYQWEYHKMMPMLGSYGCVRQCSFCDVIKHFPRYQYIEADQLTQDIVLAWQQTQIDHIHFMDSLVNGSMTNFLALLKNLAHARQQKWLPDNFRWSGTYICRPPSALLDKIHHAMADSGADTLVIGVESGSDRIRFEMDKKFTNNDLLDELEQFNKVGVKSSLLFFPSWPTETLDDFNATLSLFYRLRSLSHKGTVRSVMLGVTGFSLIDDTPIHKNRSDIGLTQGPKPWLWHCDKNPNLNFWESVRRRLVMAEVCENLGIFLDSENTFRRYLLFNLIEYRDIIKDYVGSKPKFDLPFYDAMPFSCITEMSWRVVNSGDQSVNLCMIKDNEIIDIKCEPGITPIKISFASVSAHQRSFSMTWKFHPDYRPCWKRHPNKEFYSANGLYLDDIMIDDRNITLWGWDQMVDQQFNKNIVLPDNFYEMVNKRYVCYDSVLTWTLPAQTSMHRYINNVLYPNITNERRGIDVRLHEVLNSFF